MLNPRPSIIYGQTGQVVEFYPPESHLGAADAAATYAVYALDEDLDDTAEFSGTATLDSVATTFNASSGFSQDSLRDRCRLTAVTGIVLGRLYLAANSKQERELVRVDAIDATNLWVSKEGPLAYDYASSDTFKGLRHTFTIDPTFVADESNIGRGWRVLWTYAIGGTTYKTWTYFDLVRVRVRHQVTEDDLYARFPDLRHQQPLDTRGQGWRQILREAEHRVAFDLETKYKLTLDEIRTELLNRLVLSAAVWVLSEFRCPKGRELTEFNQQQRIQYYHDLNALEGVAPVDKGSDGGATQTGSGTSFFER